ncbi:hypothetical protein N8E86_09835 [Avibacterium paragallinarum]|uniref:hypothetical protein n=1 Tax=Avibacterium paragallinarum TaxID=728 RepID=UPI0021F6B40E|nr:hypothetical protein [Avibacterium paragallinarum]UXN34345.1 hypothetical protein N8E86_09835 [Avibacterium paragallinarum]
MVKNIIILLVFLTPSLVIAMPGVECALNPSCGFGSILSGILLLVVIFIGAYVFEKIKNLFK